MSLQQNVSNQISILGKKLKIEMAFDFWGFKQKKNSKTFCFVNIAIKWVNDLYETLTWFWNSKTLLLLVLLSIIKFSGLHSCSSPITFVMFHTYSFTAGDGVSKPRQNDIFSNVSMWKNHIHGKKVGHTTRFLFGIYWWTWKTNIYLKKCWSWPIKNKIILTFTMLHQKKRQTKS